jgi:hypothetical protein
MGDCSYVHACMGGRVGVCEVTTGLACLSAIPCWMPLLAQLHTRLSQVYTRSHTRCLVLSTPLAAVYAAGMMAPTRASGSWPGAVAVNVPSANCPRLTSSS